MKKHQTKKFKRIKKEKKDGETIQESSNQFTPFRRAVCDWLFEEKVESKDLSYWLGHGRAVGPRTTQYPGGGEGGGPLEESAVPSVLAVRGVSG